MNSERFRDLPLGETQEANLFKNSAMLKTLDEIEKLDEKSKSHTLSVLDGFLQFVKFKNIASL